MSADPSADPTARPAAGRAPYHPRRSARSTFVPVRGHQYHVLQWGTPADAEAARPPLVLVHGWMDVAASYQFVVDALAADRWVLAPDWRGFGLTSGPATDTYWFADYLGDLDALLTALLPPPQAVDLAGHSMGGNVVMAYAGVRPARVRRLINLEGFGMPRTRPEQAPRRIAQWLDELATPKSLRDYDSLAAVAARLLANNPRLRPEFADWLAPHWAGRRDDGRWQLRSDPAHKRPSPLLYQVDEQLAIWRRIEAPLLWLEGADTDIARWWGERYTKPEFHERLAAVRRVERRLLPDCGHMLHHDQPHAVAALLEAFLDAR